MATLLHDCLTVIVLDVPNALRLVLLGALLFASLHNLSLCRAGQGRVHMLMAAWSLHVATYVIGALLLATSETTAEAQFATRMQQTSILLSLPLLVVFARELGGRSSRMTWAWILALVPLALVWLTSLSLGDTVELRQDALGMSFTTAGRGPVGFMLLAISAAFAGYALYESRADHRSKDRYATDFAIFLGVAVAILLPAGANDLALNAGLVSSVHVLEIGYALVTLGSSWVLVRRARRLCLDLQTTVFERTGELAQARGQQNNLRAQLERADHLASLGQLLAGIAHEINNPLTYTIGNISEARLDLAEMTVAPADAAYLEVSLMSAQDGAHRISEIVRDVQRFSQGKRSESSVIALGPVLERSARMAQHQVGNNSTLELAANENCSVRANQGRLSQVILNLMVNAAHAVRYSKRGSGRVEVSCQRRGDCVVIEISDDGDGIAPELLDRVFDPFFTTKPVGVGTGLGLAISRDIVRSLGGDLSLMSGNQAGTVARVVLPAADARCA